MLLTSPGGNKALNAWELDLLTCPLRLVLLLGGRVAELELAAAVLALAVLLEDERVVLVRLVHVLGDPLAQAQIRRINNDAAVLPSAVLVRVVEISVDTRLHLAAAPMGRDALVQLHGDADVAQRVLIDLGGLRRAIHDSREATSFHACILIHPSLVLDED